MFRAAAKQGEACGLSNYADCFRCGTAVTKNYKKALYYYRKSVQKGDLYSKCQIGEMTMKGMGVKKDVKKGYKLIEEAARAGCREAQFSMYEFYRDGNPCIPRRNMGCAIRWLKRAAEQEDAEACKELARCYREGIGVDKDTRLARKWERIAAGILFPGGEK